MSKLSFTTPGTILFVSICFYLATIPAARSNNASDFRALVAFKNAIATDTQGALNSWNETVHFCTWRGVLCSHRHKNRVVELDLTSQGLVGSISPHIGNLSFLRFLTLQNNTFYGRIPNEIGRLKRLLWVEFSNNSLTGEIPRNISQCTNMYYLNLIDNNLTGSIPPELSSLVYFEALGLTDNQLSGTIPPFIGNFTRLVQLSLSGMRGQIPESLVQLKSLQFLVLGDYLTGSVPPGLFNISTMSIFDLSLNRLEGTIPSDIGSTFPNLSRLSLWGNLFTGEIPASLSNISSLENLRLQSNKFKGRVKIDFSRLSALTRISMAYNNLEGDFNFISSAINCTQLIHFEISSNQLSGLLPHSIANLSSNLILLNLDHNQFYGTIPSGIGELSSLILINLSNNDLDGPIPSNIGKLNKLQALYLSGNKFTSKIPFSFGNFTSLIYLSLDRNNFSGNMPQSLSNCIHLQNLNISYNNLNGPIPPQIMSRVSNTIFLDLSHNALTGSIPVEVGSLINLGTLDLSYNRLSGLVPNSLSSCVRLEEVYLQSNFFYGEMPDELRTLRGLQRLDLSQNNLSGTIPTFLGELDILYLNLSFNRLEGEIPNRGVFLNRSALSLQGNTGLCGGIQSLNFTPCSLENSKKKRFPIMFKVLIPVVSIGAIALACYCLFIYKQGKAKHAQTPGMVSLEEGYLRLSYADLQKSTEGFSEKNLLGAGKFGSVYKGILHDVQSLVAVKVLHLNVKGASKSFMSECNVLRSIRHRNLVKILSVCSSTDYQGNDFKALVYEFMANGNLDEWLHPKPDDENRSLSRSLSFKQRLNIAFDIASAIEYLHCGTDSTIVHGDLKPSNILLDGEMLGHVGDFGLAKVVSTIFSIGESGSTGIQGTVGYIPPEYGMSSVVSTEGDAYSYGILLLEIVTGRRPTDDELNGSSSLRDLVEHALPNQVMEIVDPVTPYGCSQEMKSKTVNCMVSLLEIGLACSKELPRDRMSMTSVVNELRKIVHMA